MPKVAFSNILDENVKYKEIDGKYLTLVVYEYARTHEDEEIYKEIMGREKVGIKVNGEIIHPDNWSVTELKESDIVDIHPQFGNSDTFAIFQIVVGAALMAFAPALSFTIGILKVTSAMVFALGLSFALGGVSYLLFKPDLPTMPGSTSSSRSSSTYNWSGISTMAQEDTPIPVVYGTHAIGGNIISLYTDIENRADVYLNMLIALCEGEIEGICKETNYSEVCSTTDYSNAAYVEPAIFFDDQPMSQYSDIEWWYRNGGNEKDAAKDQYDPTAQNKVPYFDGSRAQYDDGREITVDGVEYTTTKEVDMVQILFRCPQLYESTTSGIIDAEVRVKVEYKPEGGTYTSYEQNRWSISTSGDTGYISASYTESYNGHKYGNTNLPSYTITCISSKGYTPPETWSYGVQNITQEFSIEDSDGNIVDTVTVSGVLETQFAGLWIAPRVVRSNISSFTVGPYTIKPDVSTIVGKSVTVSSSGTLTSEFIISGTSKTSLWGETVIDFNNTGTDGKSVYVFRVTRTNGEASDSTSKSDNCILNSIIEVVQGEFIYPNTALLGLRIKATDQISGSPPNVITVVKGRKVEVPDLEDASPSGTDVTFDDCFWDNTNSEWVDTNGTVYWNDTTKYRTATPEWTNNAILCTRDLIINTRFGLGKYINTDNLHQSGIANVIKDCHIRYIPTTSDLCSWWDSGTESEFNQSIIPRNLNEATFSVDSSNRKLSCSGHSIYLFKVKLNCDLSIGEVYTFSITTSGITGLTELSIDVLGFESNILSHILKEFTMSNVNGTFSSDITINKSNIKYLLIRIKSTSSDNIRNFSVDVDDISFTGKSGYMHYHEWDGVFDSQQSAMTVLMEMCDSYRTWPVWYEGALNFVYDKDDTPVHTVSYGNTTEFSQSFTPLSEIPYKIFGQFTDESDRFNLQSMIAKSTDTTLNKLNEKTIGLKGITSRKVAERELKFKLNKAVNTTHGMKFKCGLDAIHCTAGDIFNFQDNLLSWGKGGRVLDYNISATTLTLDATYNFSDVDASYIIKYQKSNNSFVTATVQASPLLNATRILPLKSWVGTPVDSAVYIVGEPSDIKKYRALSVIRTKENEVECEAIEHLASMYTATNIITIPDERTRLPNPLRKPKPPTNCEIFNTNKVDGIGFELKASPGLGDDFVKDIIVKMSISGGNNYTYITSISVGRGYTKYVDDSLEIEKEYDFMFYAKSSYNKISNPTFIKNVKLNKENYIPDKPSGISVKNTLSPNSGNWEGRDCIISWNPVGINYANRLRINGYKVEVYHDDDSINTNLLRTDNVSNEKYTYTLDMNIEDASKTGTGIPYSILIFRVYTKNIANIESIKFARLVVENSNPSTPTVLTSDSKEDAVIFKWAKNPENDIKYYQYKTKVDPPGSTGDWDVSWTNLESNSFERKLTVNETASQGAGRSTVNIRIRAYDEFQNTSASVDYSASCVNEKVEFIVSPTEGLGHFQYIQDALNALPSGGGKIILKEGTYDLSLETGIANYSNGLVIPDKNVDIVGVNRDSVIIEGDPNSKSCLRGSNTSDKSYSIENITINSNIWYDTSYYCYVMNFFDSNDITINKVTVNSKQARQFFSATPGVAYYDNIGIGVSGNIVNITNNKLVYGEMGIKANTIYNSGNIHNNYCASQYSYGIYHYSFDGTSNVNIHNNIVRSFKGAGIAAFPNNNGVVKIINNSIKTMESVRNNIYGVYLNNLGDGDHNISGNKISINPSDSNNKKITGIRAGVSDNDNIISNNTISISAPTNNYTQGISLYNYSNSNISDNVIKVDNTDTTKESYGIIVYTFSYNSNENIINGNNINMVNSNAKAVCISLDSSSNDNTVNNNQFRNFGKSCTNEGKNNDISSNYEAGNRIPIPAGRFTRQFTGGY